MKVKHTKRTEPTIYFEYEVYVLLFVTNDFWDNNYYCYLSLTPSITMTSLACQVFNKPSRI